MVAIIYSIEWFFFFWVIFSIIFTISDRDRNIVRLTQYRYSHVYRLQKRVQRKLRAFVSWSGLIFLYGCNNFSNVCLFWESGSHECINHHCASNAEMGTFGVRVKNLLSAWMVLFANLVSLVSILPPHQIVYSMTDQRGHFTLTWDKKLLNLLFNHQQWKILNLFLKFLKKIVFWLF